MLAGLTQSNLLCPVTPKARPGRFQLLNPTNTIEWNVSRGPVAQITLTGSHTLATPAGITQGGTYILIVKQGTGGLKNMAFSDVFTWILGEIPGLSLSEGAVDILSFVSDGTQLYGVIQREFE